MSWLQYLNTIKLDAAGSLALADVNMIAERTALKGTSGLQDTLILCPGMHREQAALDLNNAEYPAVAAMTTGYVFRVENQATVFYLQRIGRPGCLTTVKVSREGSRGIEDSVESLVCRLLYDAIPHLTIFTISWMAMCQDWWGVGVMLLYISCRLFNMIAIHRRSQAEWKGALEEEVHGDLLILLSQDKWVRMRGLVDDLKMVTSGSWLRDSTLVEKSLVNIGTILPYFALIAAANSTQESKVIIILLLLVSGMFLTCSNAMTKSLRMQGCVLRQDGDPVKYARRRDMADQLIEETGRNDWAIRLGMIVNNDKNEKQSRRPKEFEETVTM
ncbi:MAG: hypothetical protein Q9227_004092 [Pyrenula ochraceoflavens]